MDLVDNYKAEITANPGWESAIELRLAFSNGSRKTLAAHINGLEWPAVPSQQLGVVFDFYFNSPEDFLLHAQADWPFKRLLYPASSPDGGVSFDHHVFHLENSSSSSSGGADGDGLLSYEVLRPHARDLSKPLVVLDITS